MYATSRRSGLTPGTGTGTGTGSGGTSLRQIRSSLATDALSSGKTSTTTGATSSSSRSTTGQVLSNSRIRATLAPSENRVIRQKKSGNSTSEDAKEKNGSNLSSTKRNFLAAPKKTLNIIDVDTGSGVRGGIASRKSWSQRAAEAIKNDTKVTTLVTTTAAAAKKETKRARKRREWMEKQKRIEAGQTKLESKYRGDWARLPDLVLEQIFQYLSYKSKLTTALVCQNWSRIAYVRSVWSFMQVQDNSMTVSRFNYAGKFYEEVLDHIKASRALNKLAAKLKRLAFAPKKNLHVICSFQQMMTKFCRLYGPMPDIESFKYVFPCDFARKSNEIDIYGTGGMILQDMKDLLVFLPGLKRLELTDLELDSVDASHVLDEVSEVCCERITILSIINISRGPLPMLAIASFVNLRVLYISPHNLNDDLVECFGDMRRLRNVQVVTNAYTEALAPPVDYRVWKACRKSNPRLRVHLVTEGKHKNEMVLQQRAPVKSVVYDTPYSRVTPFYVNMLVELYKTDLECFAHKRLPRFHMKKSFHERPDSSFLYLVNQCPYIHTLMIRERISSATVLLLAYSGKNLRYLHIRRNAIMLKCDWPRNPDWTFEFYSWLQKNSRSYDSMEKEVSQILGFRWYALNDKQFKLTPLNINTPYYYEGFEENC